MPNPLTPQTLEEHEKANALLRKNGAERVSIDIDEHIALLTAAREGLEAEKVRTMAETMNRDSIVKHILAEPAASRERLASFVNVFTDKVIASHAREKRLVEATEQLITAMVQLGKEHHREVAFARSALAAHKESKP